MTEPLEIEGSIQDSTDAFHLMREVGEYLRDETAARHGVPLHVSVTVEVGKPHLASKSEVNNE